jgi:hypothetical protein
MLKLNGKFTRLTRRVKRGTKAQRNLRKRKKRISSYGPKLTTTTAHLPKVTELSLSAVKIESLRKLMKATMTGFIFIFSDVGKKLVHSSEDRLRLWALPPRTPSKIAEVVALYAAFS